MNISFNNRDAVSGVLKIEVDKADYIEQVESSLRDFRRKANLPGFRKGMVPMGIINKMYRKHVLAEEVNKCVSTGLNNYFAENKIAVLGEPIPNETQQKEFDFATDEEFEFCFDVALPPAIDIELTDKDTLPYYQVRIEEDLVDRQIASYRDTFTTYDADALTVEEKDLLVGQVCELENGAPKEGGLVVERASLTPFYLKNEEEKHKFIGAEKGSTVVFDLHKAYEGEESEIAAFLKIGKEELEGVGAEFSFQILEITRYAEAKLDQDLFDKVFGEGVVASEEAFRAKIKESLSEQYTAQSDHKLLVDVREFLLSKAEQLVLADDILKRWLLLSEEDKTKGMDQVEEEYPNFLKYLKYTLVRNNLMDKHGVEVTESDVDCAAKKIVKAQFAQFGMTTVPDDLLGKYANNLLKDKKSFDHIIDNATSDKFVDWVKRTLTLEVKELSMGEFAGLFQKKSEEQPA